MLILHFVREVFIPDKSQALYMFRPAQTPIKLCIQIAVDLISCNLLYLRGGGGGGIRIF